MDSENENRVQILKDELAQVKNQLVAVKSDSRKTIKKLTNKVILMDTNRVLNTVILMLCGVRGS